MGGDTHAVDPLVGAKAIPILRMFDIDKARAFYVGFLGLKVDWEHRFKPDMPLYMQLSRGDLMLHLSEHHGDGTPGTIVFVRMEGLADYHREILSKGYRFMRPGLERQDWGDEMTVIDPFGNQIRFCQNKGHA